MRPVIFVPVALAAMVIAAAALAADTEPGWLKKPTAEDLLSVWPAEAARRGIGGKATVACTVTAQGALRDCKVVSETPAGSGFGAAAIALTPQFLMKPATKDGIAVASEVRIPINFDNGMRGSMNRLPQRLDAFQTRLITNMPWIEAPTVADVRAVLPPAAKTKTARVTLDCRVAKDGRLTGCDAAREEPSGQGFAKAAKALVGKFRAPTDDGKGGSLVGAHVHLPFTFAPEIANAAAPLIGKPQWAALPGGEDIDRVAPQAARKAGVLKARVVLGCTVGAGGTLTDCKVKTEEPSGHGYDAATLALAQRFRLSVWSAEGLPTVGGQVNVPVRYDLPPLETAAAGR
ncbi:TonB family protein [Phenylobacterium sp.]|uniref:TonB family protein n=1 Tax=Phenylobacterium sp. TaxID=1871053 RepID=UPI002F925F45